MLGLSAGSLDACTNTLKLRYQPENFGDIRLLHLTDSHAQLLPLYFREPSVNIGLGPNHAAPPHIVGQQFLDFFGIRNHSALAYAFTYLNFVEAAEQFGKMGGFAHLMTLVKQLRGLYGEENTLLLDGGDTWQGSATALWSQGMDMVQASNLLGVDVMTGHWEFTYAEERINQNIEAFQGDFVAQNVKLSEEAQFQRETGQAQVFQPYVIKSLPKGRVAVIGQAFPYTPIANPKRFIPDWNFGIQEHHLQNTVDMIRERKLADVVVLLSHNGMDVDLKLASRITGIDFILGGHTHDAMPQMLSVQNQSGVTHVANSGCHGKFLAVLDIQLIPGRVKDFRFQLLPVFSNLLSPDPDMQQLIDKIRQPYLSTLRQPLTQTESLLYRRDNFYGSFDMLILSALRLMNQTQIALSPGFRWGASLLPGQVITIEDVMSQTAITYPETYTRTVTGMQLKNILEDVCDNLFNPDPYYRQGGDMVRVGGLTYHCYPNKKFGDRISELRLPNGDLIMPAKRYSLSGWATVNQRSSGVPVWQQVQEYLSDRKTIRMDKPPQPFAGT